MSDFDALEEWAAGLLARLAPAERGRVMRAVGGEIRQRQSQRIASQKAPDGSAYAPRAPMPKGLRARAGQIRRRGMFAKLRTSRFLKATTTADEIAVGFEGRGATIARVHQFGQRRTSRRGQLLVTPARVLIGLNEQDREFIADTLLKHIAGGG
jgi:phage virion morphogenesis protein